MVNVTKIFEFAASHYLPSHEGKCKNDHGHNFKLEVTVTGEIKTTGPEAGMIIDFNNLKEIVKRSIIDTYDHSCLNVFFHNPTAEVLSLCFSEAIQKLLPHDVFVVKVRVWETSFNYATWVKGLSK